MSGKNKAAVVILLNDRQEVLVLKRSPHSNSFPNRWNFPGGGVEPGEDIREAAVREMKEEANLEINEKDLKYFDVLYFPSLTIHFFITDKFKNTIQINHESSEYQWASIKELRELQFIGPNQKMIDDIELYLDTYGRNKDE